jgi:hypothetical protein
MPVQVTPYVGDVEERDHPSNGHVVNHALYSAPIRLIAQRLWL